MSSGCSDPSFCRDGCCRNFLGTQFCDIQSNCITAPTWIVALVPIMLGLAAIVLLILVYFRLKNRKVIEHYNTLKFPSDNENHQIKESDRDMESERPFHASHGHN